MISTQTLFAQDDPQRGFSVRNSLGGMLNPTGASLSTRVYYTEPLYGEREGAMWQTARMEIGLSNHLSPAYDDVSIDLFVEPAAVFDFRTNIGVRYAYNTFGYGYTPVSSYDIDYSDAGSLPSETKTGLFIRLTPRIKLAFGPVVFLNALTWSYFSFNYGTSKKESTPYFYEPTNDVIIKDNEGLMKNETTLLYRFPVRDELTFLSGLNHSIVFVQGSSYTSQKLSAMAAVQLEMEERGLSFDAAVLLGAFLRNRYYGVDEGYASPALNIGVTKRL